MKVKPRSGRSEQEDCKVGRFGPVPLEPLVRMERTSLAGRLLPSALHDHVNALQLVLVQVEALGQVLSAVRPDLVSGRVQVAWMSPTDLAKWAEQAPAKITDAVARLQETVALLRKIAQVCEMKTSASPRILRVPDIARQAVALTSSLVRRRSVTINLSIGDESLAVWGESQDLLHVFVSVLLGALDATSGRSEPVSMRLESDSEAQQVVIRVRFCGETSRAETVLGRSDALSLGLAVSDHLVDRFQGRVSLEMGTNSQTTVLIRLPANPVSCVGGY